MLTESQTDNREILIVEVFIGKFLDPRKINSGDNVRLKGCR
jgi:hypothetical protein